MHCAAGRANDSIIVYSFEAIICFCVFCRRRAGFVPFAAASGYKLSVKPHEHLIETLCYHYHVSYSESLLFTNIDDWMLEPCNAPSIDL